MGHACKKPVIVQEGSHVSDAKAADSSGAIQLADRSVATAGRKQGDQNSGKAIVIEAKNGLGGQPGPPNKINLGPAAPSVGEKARQKGQEGGKDQAKRQAQKFPHK